MSLHPFHIDKLQLVKCMVFLHEGQSLWLPSHSLVKVLFPGHGGTAHNRVLLWIPRPQDWLQVVQKDHTAQPISKQKL